MERAEQEAAWLACCVDLADSLASSFCSAVPNRQFEGCTFEVFVAKMGSTQDIFCSNLDQDFLYTCNVRRHRMFDTCISIRQAVRYGKMLISRVPSFMPMLSALAEVSE